MEAGKSRVIQSVAAETQDTGGRPEPRKKKKKEMTAVTKIGKTSVGHGTRTKFS